MRYTTHLTRLLALALAVCVPRVLAAQLDLPSTPSTSPRSLAGDCFAFDAIVDYPPQAAAGPLPVVLALHWAGGPDTYREFARCLAIPAVRAVDSSALIIAPSSSGLPWQFTQAQLVALARGLAADPRIDASQIRLLGYSNGAIVAHLLLTDLPDVFAGGVCAGGSYERCRSPRPLRLVHGEADELFPVRAARKYAAWLAKKGGDASLTVVPARSHYEACRYVEAVSAAYGQLLPE